MSEGEVEGLRVADGVVHGHLLGVGGSGQEQGDGGEDGDEPCGETRHGRTLGPPAPAV